jgi:hypothetical protein
MLPPDRRLEQNGIRATGDSAAPTMKRPSESQPREVLAGLVERVTYHNAENGFCVLRAKARGHRDVVTVDVRFTPNCWTYRRGAANRRFGPIATEPQIIRQSFRTRSLPAPLCFAAETGGICMGADVHCLEC